MLEQTKFNYLGMPGCYGHLNKTLLNCLSISSGVKVVLLRVPFNVAAEDDAEGESGP